MKLSRYNISLPHNKKTINKNKVFYYLIYLYPNFLVVKALLKLLNELLTAHHLISLNLKLIFISLFD